MFQQTMSMYSKGEVRSWISGEDEKWKWRREEGGGGRKNNRDEG